MSNPSNESMDPAELQVVLDEPVQHSQLRICIDGQSVKESPVMVIPKKNDLLRYSRALPH